MTAYTVPYLPNVSEAYELQKLYMTQNKQDIDEYNASIKRYADITIAIDTYLLQMAQEYRDCWQDGDLLGMATALQDSEKAAWSMKYLTLQYDYLAWHFKRGVMHINLNQLAKLPPPPKPVKVVEVKPVEVKRDGCEMPLHEYGHIALLTSGFVRESVQKPVLVTE